MIDICDINAQYGKEKHTLLLVRKVGYSKQGTNEE
jgi:hypothetical protein